MSSHPAKIPDILRPPASATVESSDTTRITYDLYDGTSRSAVLVVPGFWRDRRHASMVALAASLNGRGYRVAVMDPRGHGESEGVYGFNLKEHYDTAAVAEHLLQRLPIDTITLVGFSYGGAVAISTAARDNLPIASVLLVSPVADFKMIAPQINPFTILRHIAFSQAFRRPRFEWRMRRSAKLSALEDVRDVHAPLCFVHVKNDWLIGHSHSIALYESANEPKELHVFDIPGNYHADRIFSVARETIEPVVFEFLERYSA